MTETEKMHDTGTIPDRKFTKEQTGRFAGYDDAEVARARGGSTPEALTIIDPFAAPTRLRRLSDGFDVL